MHYAFENAEDRGDEMMKRSLISRLLDLIFPPKCVICGEVVGAHEVLCAECFDRYKSERAKPCKICGRPAPKCNCGRHGEIGTHICSAFYVQYSEDKDSVIGKMIFTLKRHRNVRLAELFAREASAAIMKHLKTSRIDLDGCIITFPPRSEKAFDKYGFDHAELVAEKISYYTGIPLAYALERFGGGEQKTLDMMDRLANARDTLGLRDGVDVKDKTVLLFDDVITTGSTMIASAELLRKAGAEEVIAVTVAKTAQRK